jgi:hypothetical protein
MRDPYVLEDPDQPGSLLMYYVAGNSFDQTQQSPPLFFRNAVGIVRSQGPSLTQVWSDLGYLRSTDGKHGVTGNAESPHVFPDNAHADAGGQAAGLWRLMFTDGPAYPDSSIRFEVAQGRISDTTLASWQPTPVLPTKLYDYLHQDFTVYGWEATEYLHVAPVDFLAAYDGTGIPITRMYWTGTDFVLGFPDVSAPRGGREVAALGFAVSELALGSGLVRLAIDVPVTATVTITAYDVMGRRIKRIFDRRVPSGRTLVSWDGCSDSGERVSSGIYFAQLTCEMGRRVVRIPLVR